MPGRRALIIVVTATVLLAGLLGTRRLLATDPLHRLRPSTEGRSGSWWFPRGGPYLLGFEAPGPAELIVDHEPVATGTGRIRPTWKIFGAGAHAVTFRGPPGSRLLWLPPGRRGQLEYVPESSLSPAAPAQARFHASYRDAAIAAAIVLVLAGAGCLLLRPRIDVRSLGAACVFVLALAVRLWGLGEAGQTWDEDEYTTSGRNYWANLLSLDFRAASWTWNQQHPPVTKYIAGLGALWQDGFDSARALFVVLSAATAALVFLIGRRWFGARAALLAAAAAALSPHLVGHGQIIGHETPSVFFWTLAVWLALRASDDPTFLTRRLIGVGVVFGLAVATRFTNLLLAPVTAAALCVLAPRLQLPKILILGPTLGVLAAAVTFFGLWPRLWSAPIAHLDAAWNVLKNPHAAELYLGAIVARPPWHYFPVYLLATTPVVLLGAALGLGAFRAARRREPGFWILAVWVLMPFGVAWSPVRQDGVRYVLPALVPLCLAAGAGLDELATALRSRMVGAVLGGAFVGYLGVTSARIRPYYIDYYGEQVGGPAAVARRAWFELGWWGEGIGEAVAYVNRHAAPQAAVCRLVVPDHVTWFREDLWRSMTKIPAQAQWIIVNGPSIREGNRDARVPADAQMAYEVNAQGAPLVQVYRRVADVQSAARDTKYIGDSYVSARTPVFGPVQSLLHWP